MEDLYLFIKEGNCLKFYVFAACLELNNRTKWFYWRPLRFSCALTEAWHLNTFFNYEWQIFFIRSQTPIVIRNIFSWTEKKNIFKKCGPAIGSDIRKVDKRVYKPLTRFTFNFVSIPCETKEHLIQRGRCRNDLKLFRERRTIISRYAEQLVTWLNLTKSLFISSLGDSNTNGWLLYPLKTNFPFTK